MAGAEIVTQRLRLRDWRAADEGPMAAINRDPEVTRFLNRPVDEQAVTAFFGAMVEHWDVHGFGLFAVESCEADRSGAFLGFVGVGFPTFLPEVSMRPELGGG